MFQKQAQLLLQALQITDSDLQSNYRKTLSNTQYQFLWDKRVKETGLRTIPIPLVAILLISNLNVITLDGKYFPSSLGFDILMLLVSVGILSFSFWYVLKIWRQYSLDLRDGMVESIEGAVVQNPKARGRTTRYSILIANREFEVPGRVMLAFQNGGSYRVFYAPHSKTVVSAEAIRAEGES